MHNRLTDSTSPYLRQHAGQPVHWQPWDADALALARDTGRPIFLSIGYSTCHWCHVMAHESFDDPGVAALLNTSFVSIKVDREERPDLDRVYQLAHHLLNRQGGGWPLTLFLDPDTLVPFFSGTYFPRTTRGGMPGFEDLLVRVATVFAERRDALAEQGGKLAGVLAELNPPGATPARLDDRTLVAIAREQLGEQYDRADGGFGQAPKFPMPTAVERLLLGWARARRGSEPDREALEMVMQTLTRMARGGIYDHLGGGFCRYATDRKWIVPHFEKMLCDNGQLLALYADACAVSRDELFTETLRGTADWLLRDMRDPGGAFYAAVDADSEDGEGRYYVWRRDEVKRLLDEDEHLVVETLYGLDKPANFSGRWVLHRRDAWRAVVERLGLERADADRLLASARAKLLARRATRTPPAVDDKVLAGWNGLAIKGLARAAGVLDEPAWLEAARTAMDFLRTQLWRDGVLYACWAGGRATQPAFLDDYANLIDALLALLAAGWRETDARFAIDLGDALLRDFEDREHGGFWFTRHDHEPLIHRPKPTLDEAQSAGNGTAARVLLTLGHLFARADYLASAGRTLAWARGSMEQYPAGHCSLLAALEYEGAGAEQIVIRGPAAELGAWQAAASSGYQPWRAVYAIPYGPFRTLPGYLPKLVSAEQQQTTNAYWCTGTTCEPPITSLEAFRARAGASG
ncbi:MAG: thioredoxin domain-containing protein [Pseudomonadales bacterium]|nr:thioredoxin domain-containing protein [Pseudomonadales bacterium]